MFCDLVQLHHFHGDNINFSFGCWNQQKSVNFYIIQIFQWFRSFSGRCSISVAPKNMGCYQAKLYSVSLCSLGRSTVSCGSFADINGAHSLAMSCYTLEITTFYSPTIAFTADWNRCGLHPSSGIKCFVLIYLLTLHFFRLAQKRSAYPFKRLPEQTVEKLRDLQHLELFHLLLATVTSS